MLPTAVRAAVPADPVDQSAAAQAVQAADPADQSAAAQVAQVAVPADQSAEAQVAQVAGVQEVDQNLPVHRRDVRLSFNPRIFHRSWFPKNQKKI